MKFNHNWTNTEDGTHDGGQSFGPGFCISWQRGPLNENGRNGAFVIDVLEACLHQLKYFQNSKFACPENEKAISHINQALSELEIRLERRKREGVLGTSEVDQKG